MNLDRILARLLLSLLLCACAPVQAQTQTQGASATAGAAELPLFAVEIRLGPKWDSGKPPQEQAFFREHSANLKRLRDAGSLVIGARYADKGLVVLAAGSIAEARAMMDQDPSVAAGVFAYEAHPFNVFYAGEVKARPRR